MRKISARPRIQHLVPNNPAVDRATKDPEEVAAERRAIKNTLYDSSYRTATGHWKRRDEPDEAEQLRQSDRIRKNLLARQQQASRERLKSKGVVPTKQGKKLFDAFMREARSPQTVPVMKRFAISADDFAELKNLYNAASALEFDKWVLFIKDTLERKDEI